MLPRPPVIVLAEDNADLRALLAAGLERSGFDVRQATTGVELVDQVLQGCGSDEPPVTLIVADVRMPKLDGIGALRIVRASGLATPAILMTAFADARVTDAALDLRSVVLDKPLGVDALRMAVARVLRRATP